MAKAQKRGRGRPKGSKNKAKTASVMQGSNGLDSSLVENYIAAIESKANDIAVARAAFMKKCEPLREDIREIYSAAEDHGLPKKTLKVKIGRRALLRKYETIREKLAPYEQDELDLYDQAMGDFADTSLAQAARPKTTTPIEVVSTVGFEIPPPEAA